MPEGCPRCREWSKSGAKYCGDCGRRLSGDHPKGPDSLWDLFPTLCVLAVTSVVVVDLIYCISSFTTIARSASAITYTFMIPLGPFTVRIGEFTGSTVWAMFAVIIVTILVCLIVALRNHFRTAKDHGNKDGSGSEKRSGLTFTSCALCLSLFLSAVFLVVAGAMGGFPDTSWMSDFTNEQMTFSLNRAGVREELLYRLLWIGLPMMVIAFIWKRDKRAYMHLMGGSGISKTAFMLIAISSLMFGLAHLDGWGFSKVPDAVIGGIIFGYIYVEHGLHYSILAHVANDTVTSIAYIGLGEVAEAVMFVSLLGLGFLIFIMWILKPNRTYIDFKNADTLPDTRKEGFRDWLRNH